MTAQCREHLVYNNEEYSLATEPLYSYAEFKLQMQRNSY